MIRRLVLATAALVAFAPPVAADSGLEVSIEGGGSLFESAPIAPGHSRQGVVQITNKHAEAGGLSVTATNVMDDDNGCIAAEKRAGDNTCGPGGGELAEDTLLVFTDLSDGTEIFRGEIPDLVDGIVLDRSLDGGESMRMRVTWLFDAASGNETQTDRLGFDLEMVLSQAGETAVAGEVIERGAAVRISGAELPATGRDLDRVVDAGVAALVAGVCLHATRTRVLRRARAKRRSLLDAAGDGFERGDPRRAARGRSRAPR